MTRESVSLLRSGTSPDVVIEGNSKRAQERIRGPCAAGSKERVVNVYAKSATRAFRREVERLEAGAIGI